MGGAAAAAEPALEFGEPSEVSTDAILDWVDAVEANVDPEEIPDWLKETIEEEAEPEIELPPAAAPAAPPMPAPTPPPAVAQQPTPPPPPPSYTAPTRPPLVANANVESARSKAGSGDLSGSLLEYESMIRSSAELDTVVADLSRIAQTAKDNPVVYRVLGDGLMRLGRLQEALDTYRQALNQL
jgi:hypothetical protein